MTIDKELRRANAAIRRRVKPTQVPPDIKIEEAMEYQVPYDGIDNVAVWAKMMLVVIAVSFFSGYFVAIFWAASRMNTGA